MGVPLLFGSWCVFVGFDSLQGVDFVVAEGNRGGLDALTVTRLDELHDQCGGMSCDGGELEQALCGFDLAVFEVQTLLLEGAEQLLDGPAPLVPINDLPCFGRALNLVRGQQAPAQRLLASRWVEFPDLDDPQAHAVWQGRIASVRPLDGDLAKAQLHLGAPLRTAGSLDYFEAAARGDGEACHRRIERAAAQQGTVLHGTRQQMELAFRQLAPGTVEVAFAVTDHRHHRGGRQHLLARLRRRQPATRFALTRRALVVGNHVTPLSGPDLARHQAQALAALRVDRQHGVQQHAMAVAPGNLPKPSTALPCGPEVDLTGVVDGQNVPASRSYRRLPAPTFNQAGDC